MNSLNMFLIVYLIFLELYLDKKRKGFQAIDKTKSSVDSQTLNRIGQLDAEKRKDLNVIKGGEEIKKNTLKPLHGSSKNPLISPKTHSVPSKTPVAPSKTNAIPCQTPAVTSKNVTDPVASKSVPVHSKTVPVNSKTVPVPSKTVLVTSKAVSVHSKTDAVTSKTPAAPSRTSTVLAKTPAGPSRTAQIPSLTPAVRPSMSALSEEQRKRIQENVRLKKAEKEAKFKAKEEKAKKEKEKERLKRKYQEELKAREIEEMLKQAEEKKETERKMKKEKKKKKEKEKSRKKQELKHYSRENLKKGGQVEKSLKNTKNLDTRRDKDSENEKLRSIATKVNEQNLQTPGELDKGNGLNDQKSLIRKSHAEILRDLRKEKTKIEEESKRLLTNKSETSVDDLPIEIRSKNLKPTELKPTKVSSLEPKKETPMDVRRPESNSENIQKTSYNEMEENHKTLNSTQDNSACESSLNVQHNPKSFTSLLEPETSTILESSKLPNQEASTKPVLEHSKNPNLDTRAKPSPEPSKKQSSDQSLPEPIKNPELGTIAKPVLEHSKNPNLDTRAKPNPEPSKKQSSDQSLPEPIRKPELGTIAKPVLEPSKTPNLDTRSKPNLEPSKKQSSDQSFPESIRKLELLSNAKSAPEASKKPGCKPSTKPVPESTKVPEPLQKPASANKLQPVPVTKQTGDMVDSVPNYKRKQLESTERESKLQKLQSSKVELSNLDRLRNILYRESSDSDDSDSDTVKQILVSTKNYSSTDKTHSSSHEAHIDKKPRISSEPLNSSCQSLDKISVKLDASKSIVDDPTVGDPIHENIQVDHESPDLEPLPIEILSVRSLYKDPERLSKFMETLPNPAYTIYHPKPGEIIELNDDGSSGDEMYDLGDNIPYRYISEF